MYIIEVKKGTYDFASSANGKKLITDYLLNYNYKSLIS